MGDTARAGTGRHCGQQFRCEECAHEKVPLTKVPQGTVIQQMFSRKLMKSVEKVFLIDGHGVPWSLRVSAMPLCQHLLKAWEISGQHVAGGKVQLRCQQRAVQREALFVFQSQSVTLFCNWWPHALRSERLHRECSKR